MTSPVARAICALAAFAAWAAPAAAQRWQTQYLYDEAKSRLTITDLQFPSAMRGVAVGVVVEKRDVRPVALVTSNGGAKWDSVPFKENPVSLFFLDDSLGWMVTEKGLWQTTEAGRNWVKLGKPPAPAVRVFFKDANTGWAACANKTVLETRDGGKRWQKVEEAARQPGNPANTEFGLIAFSSPERGFITGWNLPPRRQPFPDWLDPELATNRRETPHLSIVMETRDGGATWNSNSASTFGEVVRLRFGAGIGLGLITHSTSFQYPSEVHAIRRDDGKNTLVYRQQDFFVSDLWIMPDGTVYLAGTAAISKLRTVVPQRVRVLRSRDLKNWEQMPVDYRAVANSVILAGAGSGNLWLATNNGMILKLAQ